MKKSVMCLNINDFKVVRSVSRWYGRFQDGKVNFKMAQSFFVWLWEGSLSGASNRRILW